MREVPGAIGWSSSDVDLTDQGATLDAIATLRPAVVVHLAARVGGIEANLGRPADFILDNLLIDTNLLRAVRRHPPRHLIVALSTCIYPDHLPESQYPMSENDIEAGAPAPSNAAYATAKRALKTSVESLGVQDGIGWTAVVPSNLYGPGDHFGERSAHFLAAAIDKIEAARVDQAHVVEFFGTGRALRQFLFVDDVARLIATLTSSKPMNDIVNVAPSHNLSISDLAHHVARAAGYDGQIQFSGRGPDGQLRKDVSVSRLRETMPEWSAIETPLDDGLKRTIEWYRSNVAAG